MVVWWKDLSFMGCFCMLLRLDAELAARLSEEENLESKDAAMAYRLQEEADLEDEFERSTNAVATQEVVINL